MHKYWFTQDGRMMRPSDMDVEHLINAWHRMTYMTAKMRWQATQALGGVHNQNLTQATVDTFKFVRPGDVFELFHDIRAEAQKKFYDRFRLELRDVRERIFEAWNDASSTYSMPIKYEPAVRMLLRNNVQGFFPTPPNTQTLKEFLQLAKIETPHQFQMMCWNLRSDQPTVWSTIRTHNLTSQLRRIPETRFRSAMRFSPSLKATDIETFEDLPFELVE